MSRIRTVKPELFRHEGLFEAEQQYQLPLRVAFIGLFSICDRDGRFRWQPRVIKLDVLPHDALDFGTILNALAASGFIVKYEHQGQSYGYIPTWHKHQRVNKKERKSELPDPLALNGEKALAKEAKASATANKEASLDKKSLSAQKSTCLHLPSTEIFMPENASASLVENSNNEVDCTLDVIALPDSSLNQLSSPTANSSEAASDKDLEISAQKSTCFHVPYMEEHKKARGELELEKERELEEEEELEQEKEGVWGRENQITVADPVSVASEPRPLDVKSPPLSEREKAIRDIFEHWQSAMGYHQARLDTKRRRVIKEALKLGYTPEELKQAISGCALTPFNTGDNDRGQRYDGLQLILRDAEHIDRFIQNYFSPPRPKTPAQRHTENNMSAINNWVMRKQQELEEQERIEQEVHHAA